MSNRSWIHIWSRRGNPRRIASLFVGLVTAEHSPLYVAARTTLPQLIWAFARGVRRQSSEPRGSCTTTRSLPLTRRTTPTRIARVGRPPKTCLTSGRRHRPPCSQPALSYGPPWAHYLGGYQDRLLSGPLGLPGLRYTASDGVEHKDYGGEVLG
jgi:hypothetical protein